MTKTLYMIKYQAHRLTCLNKQSLLHVHISYQNYITKYYQAKIQQPEQNSLKLQHHFIIQLPFFFFFQTTYPSHQHQPINTNLNCPRPPSKCEQTREDREEPTRSKATRNCLTNIQVYLLPNFTHSNVTYSPTYLPTYLPT
jgi:transcription initiation factor TFIID subunit TAF12